VRGLADAGSASLAPRPRRGGHRSRARCGSGARAGGRAGRFIVPRSVEPVGSSRRSRAASENRRPRSAAFRRL